MCHIVTHQTAQSTITHHIISSFSHIKNKTTRTNVLSLIQNDLYCVDTNSLTYDIWPRNKRVLYSYLLSPFSFACCIFYSWFMMRVVVFLLTAWDVVCILNFLRLLIPVQLYYLVYIHKSYWYCFPDLNLTSPF